MVDTKFVRVKANRKLNFGKFDGELWYIASGETKVIPLTPVVDWYAQCGFIEILEEVKGDKKDTPLVKPPPIDTGEDSPESYTLLDDELPKKGSKSKKSGGKK